MAEDINIKYNSEDNGTLVLMYHRFNEQKYPSTNISMNIFEEQISIIKQNNYSFYKPDDFAKDFYTPKKNKKILITIDDAFKSFYLNAWPFLKTNKIPFILFVSTDAVGKFGYMDWDEIKEIEKYDFVTIGNHSSSHDYLVDLKKKDFIKDIDNSIQVFKDNLGYNPIFFSYPFGEYSSFIKSYISDNFKFSFGQHSGVIDKTKDPYELPRFPINEKYGDIKRFKFLINLYPLQFKELLPDEKFLNSTNNPPTFLVKFFKEQKNLKNINCFSDEGLGWEKSSLQFDRQTLKVTFRDKFLSRRGRINCSLNDNGVWRWFGVQFVIDKN